MTISRRKFTKLTIIGGASVAASSGIFFPKPAESLEINIPISKASSSNIFGALLTYAGVKIIDAVLSPPAQSKVDNAEETLEQEGYNQNRTQNGTISDRDVIWSQEKQENQQLVGLDKIVPNSSVAIQDTEDLFVPPKIFTSSTSLGVSEVSAILAQQHKLTSEQIKDILIPWQENFEDITTWYGDLDPTIGKNPNVGLTDYEAQQGHVLRRYERLEAGLGRVKFNIESPYYNGRITANIDFSA